ncbi:MAG: hypothetical protein BYD32DRAFT_132613 [Podila humilis]|nr:MAG: hypothetical protein BYD32DRAFT_132613 [Podila humilis]
MVRTIIFKFFSLGLTAGCGQTSTHTNGLSDLHDLAPMSFLLPQFEVDHAAGLRVCLFSCVVSRWVALHLSDQCCVLLYFAQLQAGTELVMLFAVSPRKGRKE